MTPKFGGPEYESLAATGSLCGVGDLNALAKINQLLAQYVLDSISTGVAIAFAMECYEHGIITKADTGGVELTWGSAEAVERMVHLIGRREGIGELLGEGVKRAAERLGRGAERFAMHVKGQELPDARPAWEEEPGAGVRALAHRGGPHGGAPRPALRGLPSGRSSRSAASVSSSR